MKKLSILTSILFALGLYMVPATFATGSSADSKDKKSVQGEYQKDQKGQSQAQQSKQGQQGQFQQQKQNLVLADKLNGAEVQNQQGENIGEIDRVLVDVRTGQVGFVTLVSGGILGVGDDKYIVPFNALKISQGTEAQVGEHQLRFTLNKSKDQLKKVPEGDIEEALSQDDQSRGIFEHYGVSPYWDDNQRRQNRQDHTPGQMMQDRNKDQMMQDRNKNQMMDKKDQQKSQ
ncbi:MAG: PRC-barrel domain-containing protein [Desulfuromonadales bacterium]